MTERMSDERLAELEAKLMEFRVCGDVGLFTPEAASRLFGLFEESCTALRSERATVERYQWRPIETYVKPEGEYDYPNVIDEDGEIVRAFQVQDDWFSTRGNIIHPTHWAPIPPVPDEIAAYLSDTPAPVSEGEGVEHPPFPQEVCPQGEFGECAFARAGLGLQCRTCNHYSHPGDAPKLDEWHSRLLASEGDA